MACTRTCTQSYANVCSSVLGRSTDLDFTARRIPKPIRFATGLRGTHGETRCYIEYVADMLWSNWGNSMTSRARRRQKLDKALPASGSDPYEFACGAARVSGQRQARALVAGIALALSACAVDQKTGAQSFAGIKVSDDPCAKTATTVGAILGGIAGGVIASQQSKRDDVRLAAVAAGATIGGFIGRDIDRRRCELFKIAKKHNVELSVAEFTVPEGALPTPGSAGAQQPTRTGTATSSSATASSRSAASGLTVAVRDSGRQFEPGSDQLTPQARAYFADIAEQYSYSKQAQRLAASATKEDRDAIETLRSKRILLVGHTDDTGSSRANADLSERRAMAVARVFRDQEISDSQLFYQGAGETLPVGDNHTEEGRTQNRRVEIVDVTDDATLHKYLALRTQRVEFYRPAPPESIPTVATAQAPAGSSGTAASRTAAVPPATPNRAPTTATTQRPSGTPPQPDTSSARTASTSPTQVAPQPAATQAPRAAAQTATAVAFDFGGNPASVNTAAADFGREIGPKPSFSLISTAYAAGGPVVPTCSSDRPRVSNGVKSLRDQKSISVTEYMPGLYNTSWMDTVNNNLVGLANVTVLRDGGAPGNKPNLYVYKNYKAGSGAKPDFAGQPEVNAYRGDKAILYRVFVDGPIRCMDVVFPYDNSGEARNSNLFYDKQSNLYVASFKPKVAR